MTKIPFVKESLKPTRTMTMKRSKAELKAGKTLTLCVEARNYDQHFLNDNTAQEDFRSLVYAYIDETGEPWTIEYYKVELTEKELHDGILNILNNPFKYNNLQPVHHNKN